MLGFLRKITPCFALSWYHFLLAFLGALIYRFPGKEISVIGVTGTGGKTTTVDLAGRILEEAGHKTASLSSIKFKIGEKEEENKLKMTMPGRLKIQRFLRQAVRAGCQYALLEVTSEGILQHRHRFINFAAAVFTNLFPEHIERHGSFEKYRETKGKLFKACKKIHIINLDDENVKYFLQFSAEKKIGYRINSKLKTQNSKPQLKTQTLRTIGAVEQKSSKRGLEFLIASMRFNLNLIGGFNVYNALAAICVGLSQGVSLETCRKALEKVKGVPGRMEEVIRSPFKVFVDYAFTPNALEQVYRTLKTTNYKLQTTNLICVLGACGGGRDKWKRPVLGEIAAKYCQEIILTNEDPYDENPSQILSMIKSGISNFQFPISNLYEILDRREAIKKALSLAKPADTVIITGKGCEPWICVENGKKIPWDDRKIVREEFRKNN